MFTKSGIMVGLGEERNEVLQLMDDLRAADVDFLTIGQYLQPTRKHHPVVRFVPPDEFKAYETIAYAKGFLMVSASPLTRSSHHAGEDFARLRAARAARQRRLTRPRMPQLRHDAPCPAMPPTEMFDLVADVEAIRNSCRSARASSSVRARSATGDTRNARRRHEVGYKVDPRDLHHAGHARSPTS